MVSGTGADGKNSTANFLSGLASSLPPIHELARSAGIELPEVLGKSVQADPVAPVKKPDKDA